MSKSPIINPPPWKYTSIGSLEGIPSRACLSLGLVNPYRNSRTYFLVARLYEGIRCRKKELYHLSRGCKPSSNFKDISGETGTTAEGAFSTWNSVRTTITSKCESDKHLSQATLRHMYFLLTSLTRATFLIHLECSGIFGVRVRAIKHGSPNVGNGESLP